MSYTKNSSLKIAVVRVIKFQLFQGIMAVAMVSLFKKNPDSLYSALFGLLIALIPTLVYASVVISNKIDDANTMLHKHKKALVLKFLTNALGFLTVFLIIRNIDGFALFCVYIVTISGCWTSLISSMKTK